MPLTDRISSFFSGLTSSAATLVKVALLSRPTHVPRAEAPDKEIVILGNGPSLRSALDSSRSYLESRPLMAVNFFANTPDFASLRPHHYILADPHFFRGDGNDPNVDRLWENLSGADWPMTLHIPARLRRHPRVKGFRAASPGHSTATFNLTPGEGFGPLRRLLYRLRLATPRPRNVMIPAIMQALAMGYRHIVLAGADHTWSRTLSVDDDNHVVSVQPHFYSDNEREKARVHTEYAGYHLHHILRSLYTAFAAYHTIADYAGRRGAEIVNATPGSFIDAFPRRPLPSVSEKQ